MTKTIFTADHDVAEVLSAVASGEVDMTDLLDWLYNNVLPLRVLSAKEFQLLSKSPLADLLYEDEEKQGILALQNSWLAKRTAKLTEAKQTAEAAVKASSKCVLDSLDEWESLPDFIDPSGVDGGLRFFDADDMPYEVSLEKRDARYSDKALNYGHNAQKCYASQVDASNRPVGKKHPVWIQYVVYWTGSKSTPGMSSLPKSPKKGEKS
jgi:hypothetical protein